MNFSINNLQHLDTTLISRFHQELSKRLSALTDAISNDEMLNKYVQYVKNPERVANPMQLLEGLYTDISGGIQVGSGDTDLYLQITAVIVEVWKQIQSAE